MQVQDFLETSARRFPGKTALVAGTDRRTYRQIDDDASRFAQALARVGVQHGDRVGIWLDNSAAAVVAIFGVLKAGAVLVIVNPQVKAPKLAQLANDSGAVALVTAARNAPALGSVRPSLRSLKAVFLTGTCAAGPKAAGTIGFDAALDQIAVTDVAPHERGIDVDLAALLYTSGSTGKPKGVMLTHLNIVSAIDSIVSYLENTADDIVLNVLPLAFGYGLTQLLATFRVGATLVLSPFGYTQEILSTIARERITGFALVPTIATALLKLDLAKHDLSTLRYVTNAAAALPVSRLLQLRAALPRARIFSMYGQTECLRVTYLPPDQLDVRPDSVGRGMPNEEVYIVDEQGRRVAPGVVGELVVRGAHVMKGYWRDEEATRKTLRPGPLAGERVLHTGDLFRMDAEGYLYFVSRSDDIIKTRGQKVSPREVEEVIARIPGVADVAVFGVEDPDAGEVVAAVVTLRELATVSPDDVRRHCARYLEGYMVPKSVQVSDSLPMTITGKIHRRALQSAAQDVRG